MPLGTAIAGRVRRAQAKYGFKSGLHLQGLRELDFKLGKMESQLAEKTLIAALLVATEDVVAAAKVAAPKGFLRQNIRRAVRVRKGTKFTWASVAIGVTKEAYYGVQFVHEGVPAYGLDRRPWLQDAFEANRTKMESRFARLLKLKIEQAAK